MRKNDFYVLVPSDLWPFDLKFSLPVFVSRVVYHTANLKFLRLSDFDRRTDGDGVQHLMRLPREGCIINVVIFWTAIEYYLKEHMEEDS